jgi:hypothetical protein
MQRFEIENAALWASGKKTKVRGGVEKRCGRATTFFCEVLGLFSKNKYKCLKQKQVSKNKRQCLKKKIKTKTSH